MPSFGLPEGLPRWCKAHATAGATNIVAPRCQVERCTKQAICSEGKGQLRRWCRAHRPFGALVHGSICIREGCVKRPVFGLPDGRAKWCKSHAPTGATNVVVPRCEVEGCTRYATSNYDKGLPKRWCRYHRPAGALLHGNICNEEGCETRAVFGLPDGRAAWCKSHAPDGATDVVSRRCQVEGCTKVANSNEARGLPKRWCISHRPVGAVFAGTRCIEDGCQSKPYFGFPTGRALWCKVHAPEGATDNKRRRCEVEGCTKFANSGEGKGLPRRWCIAHRPAEVEVTLSNTCPIIAHCVVEGCFREAWRPSSGAFPLMWCLTHIPGRFLDRTKPDRKRARCDNS